MKKILICGSHFTTAQAVIQKLLDASDVEISYVGRSNTMEGDKSPSVESKILPQLGVKYYSLTAGRVSRSGGWRSIVSLLKIPVGIVQAAGLIKTIKPDVVLSFGGYISVPIVVVAKLFRIPVMLHEQTLISGLSNKVCGWLADRIAVSFREGNYDFDKEKVVLTGNPIRPELLSKSIEKGEVYDFIKSAKTVNKKILYITGGNQGAQAINEVVMGVLKELTKEVRVIWQTGDSKMGNFDKAIATLKDLKLEEQVLVRKWFEAEDVNLIFEKVDLVVCRGGINTLTEIAYFNQKAIVIPYPYLYKDEQLVNGRYFEKLGYVKVVLQSDFTGQELLEMVGKELKRDLQVESNDLIITDAADRVVKEVLGLIRQ